MRKIWSFALLAALLAAAPAHAGEWQKTYTVSGTPAFTLDADDSRVEVSGWDRNEISVRVVSDRGVGIGGNEDMRVVESQNGNAVSVRLVRRHRLRIRFIWRENRVEVKVPKHARLDIRTDDGSCEATGIEGDIAVETADGAIRADDLAGHVHLETADGSIRASGMNGDVLARTEDGRIEVYGTFRRLELRSSDGSITAGAGPGSVMDDDWRLETDDGRIRLRIPDRLAADVDASADDGSVHIESDRTMRGDVGRHYARVELNGGGRTIRLRSSDGSIRLERYEGGEDARPGN